MTLLDRFRTSSPHKHPDAAVRLAFVEEVPLEERALLAEVAREDEDPRVRAAAVAKLLDPAALAAVVSAEADETVRVRATAMLRDIALEAFEDVSEADSLAAVAALADARALTAVAKGALRESTALAALAQVAEPHGRGSIARHAALETVRQAALDGLQDRAEIVAVAMNSEFRDSALAALDRLAEPADLEQVAAHATNKNAAKRARVRLREIEERAAAEARAREAAAAEARQIEAAARAAEARAREDAARAAAAPEPDVQVSDVTADEPRIEDGPLQEPAVAPEPVPAAEAAAEPAPAAEPVAAADTTAADEAAQAEADARARRDALARLRNLASRAESLAAKTDLTLKAAERVLRDVRAALAQMPALPTRDNHAELHRRLEAAQTLLSPRTLELREAADWQRFVNAGTQEQLCAKMEALEAEADTEALLGTIRDLQQQWRAAADVPRAQADALWRRFKAAHDRVWPRCEEWLAGQAARRAGHLEQKIALCERAEALADSTHWLQAADEIKKLQSDWKAIGPVSRGQEKAVWERFRSACDRFFSRRNDDLKQRKAVWADNLAKKDALCAKAEALAESTDWDASVALIKALQAEWKTIGPVKKTRSEAIWLRFRAACDAFFERYTHRHDAAHAERIAARAAVCAELEQLTAGEAAEPPADLPAVLRGIDARWTQAHGAGGRDRSLDERYAAAWSAAIARWPSALAGTELDPETKRRRLETLCEKVEQLAASASGAAGAAEDAALSPGERLARQLKERLASNTIGGKADDGSQWRAAADEARQIQAHWARVTGVPEAARRPLVERFDRACRLIFSKAGAPAGAGSGRPSGGRRPERPRQGR